MAETTLAYIQGDAVSISRIAITYRQSTNQSTAHVEPSCAAAVFPTPENSVSKQQIQICGLCAAWQAGLISVP